MSSAVAAETEEVLYNIRTYLLSGKILAELSLAGGEKLEDLTQKLAAADSEPCSQYKLFSQGCEITEKHNVPLSSLGLTPAPEWQDLQALRVMGHAFRFEGKHEETPLNHFHHLFKILLVGNAHVGKSCLLFRYADDAFTDKYVSNAGSYVEFKTKYIVADEAQRLKLHIADGSAGGYRDANAVVVVFDLTDYESFRSVPFWIESARRYCAENVVLRLVGNKADDVEHREVSIEEAMRCAALHGIEYFETSAKEGMRVKDSIHAALSDVLDRAPSGKIQNKPDPRHWNTGRRQRADSGMCNQQ